MTNNVNMPESRNVYTIFIAVSLSILFIHFYRYCPQLFELAIPKQGVVDKILTRFAHMKLFDSIFETKLVALLLLVAYIVCTTGKSTKNIKWTTAGYWLGLGTLSYFVCINLLYRDSEDEVYDSIYIIACSASCLAVIVGASRLCTYVKNWKKRDVFNKEGTSFPQEEELINTKFSINLRARYWWDG